MAILFLILGIVVGMFLWAAVIGTLFLTIPKTFKLKKAGIIKRVHLRHMIMPLIFSGGLLALAYIYLGSSFAWGLTISAIFIFLNWSHMREESMKNLALEYGFR